MLEYLCLIYVTFPIPLSPVSRMRWTDLVRVCGRIFFKYSVFEQEWRVIIMKFLYFCDIQISLAWMDHGSWIMDVMSDGGGEGRKKMVLICLWTVDLLVIIIFTYPCPLSLTKIFFRQIYKPFPSSIPSSPSQVQTPII